MGFSPSKFDPDFWMNIAIPSLEPMRGHRGSYIYVYVSDCSDKEVTLLYQALLKKRIGHNFLVSVFQADFDMVLSSCQLSSWHGCNSYQFYECPDLEVVTS